jgi:hypothetical protein
VSRLEQKLNNPSVVLVVGVVAVALNVLLYFGLFVPRVTPLIAHINPVGTSLLEAISKSGPQADSDPQAGRRGIEEPKQAAQREVVDLGPRLGSYQATLSSPVQLTPIGG